MIDLFTSALSDCQNAFSIFCEVFNSIKEVTLSIVRELNPISTGLFCFVVALGGGGGVFHPPSITPLSLKLDCSNFVQSYFQIGSTTYDEKNPNQINNDVTMTSYFSQVSINSAKKSIF